LKRNKDAVTHYLSDIVEVFGSFAPNTAAIADIKGRGVNPAYTTTGEFLLTFAEANGTLIAKGVDLSLHTAAGRYQVFFGPYDATAKTIKVWIWDLVAGTPALTNLTYDADQVVSYWFKFQKPGNNP
jgi:hypothetical protein